MKKASLCCAATHVFILSLLLSVSTARAADPATTLTITGHLVDDSGAPLDGRRVWRVRFYDAETGGTQLGATQWDYMQVSDKGMFAIPAVLPTEALSASQVWYELAIDGDSPADGLQARDVFADRVAVRNVPFAVEAQHLTGRIMATQIGDGYVDNAEFFRLDGVAGMIQTQLNSKAAATHFHNHGDIQGTAHVIVETTDDKAANGENLRKAYAAAKALTPNGLSLSAGNRAVVIVPPGRYDLGTASLNLDTDYVDLMGLTEDRKAQYIQGSANGAGTGVIMQSASDVRIQNLTVWCDDQTYTLNGDNTDPAAYFPETHRYYTHIENCRFEAFSNNARTMRTGIQYSGDYINCEAGDFAFGGSASGTGSATGLFVDCTGDDFSFGGTYEGTGTASGHFYNCTGDDCSFGGASQAAATGSASGYFYDCEANRWALGGSNLGAGTASGQFWRCTGSYWNFGGTSSGTGVASGQFRRCRGGWFCFGSAENDGASGTASGDFYGCEAGLFGFGGARFSGSTAEASGVFVDCTGSSYCFGGSDEGSGTASGIFERCTATFYSFGATNVGTAASSGTFRHCIGGFGSFYDPASSKHLFCIKYDAQYSGND